MHPYFPIDKAAQSAWYTNMATEFPGVAGSLGFTTAEKTYWVQSCQYAAYILGPMTAPIEAFTKAVTGYVNTMLYAPSTGTSIPLPDLLTWPTNAPEPVAGGIDARR